MNYTPQLLLIGAVARSAFSTHVPDHWMPIILLARSADVPTKRISPPCKQDSVTSSTLLIALAGVAFAARLTGR